MLQNVDAPTRIAVAKRFAHCLSPPPRVLQWLAGDVPQVSAEVNAHPLMQSTASAGRAANDASPAPLTHEDRLGGGKEPIAPSAAPSAGELNDLFFTAAAEERRLILLNLDVVVADAVALDYVAADPSVSKRLELAALAGDREGFAHQLARALRIQNEQAQRIIHDTLGEPIVVAAKVLNMPRGVLYRILMFINPAVGHSVERVHTLAALYDEITAPAAVSMLAIWQEQLRQKPPANKHRPLMWMTKRAAAPVPAMLRSFAVPLSRVPASAAALLEGYVRPRPPRGSCGRPDPRPQRSKCRDRISAGAQDRPRRPRRRPIA